MKTKFKRSLRKLTLTSIKMHRRFERYLLGLEDKKLGYSSLSPIDNSKDNGDYAQALTWALKNRRECDIKNIAITGPYGSGKSSILKTYCRNYTGKDLKFLFISLATFKEEVDEDDQNADNSKPSKDRQKQTNEGESNQEPLETENKSGSAKEDKKPMSVSGKSQSLRLIETSILQQIFYHEDDDKIPDSRFKKIKSYSIGSLIAYSLAYSLLLLSVYNYFHPYFIQDIFFDKPLGESICNIMHYGSYVIIVLGIYFIIFNSIRLIRSVTLSKLNFQNAEIGIGVNQNKSVFNHHIDEILYFFSVRPYNVVVIEDLDRFRETEIFTKLREINLLLNNSKKTRRKDIVFIYAVRDEMFTDKERTKFFDFIIPVISFINHSNSVTVLMAKRKEFGYTSLSDSLLEDIAFYIDDMRLLHNITNEFYLYREKLDKLLPADKLFAMITYKNIHPGDFVKLSSNDGELYLLINNRHIYIQPQIEQIEKQIKNIKAEIKHLDELSITKLDDLRLIYILRTIEKLNKFVSFYFDGKNLTIDELKEEHNFEHLVQDRLQFNQTHHNRAYNREETTISALNVSFSQIQNAVDPTRNYQTRVAEIKAIESRRINALILNLQELEQEKQKIREIPIAQLLQKQDEIISDNQVSTIPDLKTLLVRNGYIAEDYVDYISLFHEGDLTRTDYQFILNIKNRVAQPFDYKLQKTAKVFGKLNPMIFQSRVSYNYDLLNYMLSLAEKNKDQLANIFQTLSNESKASIDFINGFFEHTKHIEAFINRLSATWTNIWYFFENSSLIDSERKEQIFAAIISSAEISTIKQLAEHYDFKGKIETDSTLLGGMNHLRVESLIRQLNLKFSKLDFTYTPNEILEFIFQNNHYQLYPDLVASFIKLFGKFDKYVFEHSNYKAIHSSECPALIKYVDHDAETYISQIYLQIETNVNEDEPYFVALINHSNLSEDTIGEIIQRVATKIADVKLVNNVQAVSQLLEFGKVDPTWQNIKVDFLNHEKDLSNEAITFINMEGIDKELSKIKMPEDDDAIDDFKALAVAIAESGELNDDSLEEICPSIPWWFSDLDLSHVSEDQVAILIKKIIICPDRESFDYLKQNFKPLHIALFEQSPEQMLKLLSTLEIEVEDIQMLLESKKLNNKDKLEIIINTTESVFISDPKTLVLLAELIKNDANFKASSTVFQAILMSSEVSSENRIKVYNSQPIYTVDFIKEFLNVLGKDYAKINNSDKRPTFPATPENKKFFLILKAAKIISSYPEKNGTLKIYHRSK
jgi:hypothetical protein